MMREWKGEGRNEPLSAAGMASDVEIIGAERDSLHTPCLRHIHRRCVMNVQPPNQ